MVPLFSPVGNRPSKEALGTLPGTETIADLGLTVVAPQGDAVGEDNITVGSSAVMAGDKRSATGGETTQHLQEDKNTQQTAAQPFLLSDGLAPVPPKLVAKIQKLDFVDMAELLRDNLEVQRREASQEQQQSTPPAHRHQREIPDLLSWVSCFGVYAAILVGKHPNMTKCLLVYQTMEARRCGGSGWWQYDSCFRQQVAGNPEADWATLNTSLYAVTFLAQGSKGGQSCMSCMESDDSQNECAMLTQRPRSPFHTTNGD